MSQTHEQLNEMPPPQFYDEEYWMGVEHKATKSGYFDYQEGSTHENDAKDLFRIFNLAGKRVLDVGCCFGYQVKHLNILGADAQGVDYSPFAVENSYSRDRVMWCDVTKGLPFEDGEFDFVFSLATLEHLPKEKMEFVFEEIRRVLKPGGVTFHYPETSETEHRDENGDCSHITLKPLTWWQETLVKVFPEGRDEEKERQFLAESVSAKTWGWNVIASNPKNA